MSEADYFAMNRSTWDKQVQVHFGLKFFLKYVDIKNLQDKICKFRDLDFKKMSYKGVQDAILKVISFDTPYGSICVLSPEISTYPAGSRFYRVRKIPETDRIMPLSSMSTLDDCWEPPESIVRMGRLNRDREPLLYTAPLLPGTAVDEMRVLDNELFSLIVYEAIDDINVATIGSFSNLKDLNSENLLKIRMIQDFLKHEFTRDVGGGTEYLYRISESIAKDYFDLPNEVQDAWRYPSVAKKGTYNVCFRKAKRSKLRLVGVQLASVIRQGENYLFSVKAIAADSGSGANLIYYQIGSPQQVMLFPEIVSANSSFV